MLNWVSEASSKPYPNLWRPNLCISKPCLGPLIPHLGHPSSNPGPERPHQNPMAIRPYSSFPMPQSSLPESQWSFQRVHPNLASDEPPEALSKPLKVSFQTHQAPQKTFSRSPEAPSWLPHAPFGTPNASLESCKGQFGPLMPQVT